VPPSLLKGSPRVRRLFENYKDVEREYFARTRVYPIMHTLVIRRDVYREHPWVAQSLYAAFEESKQRAANGYRMGEAFMHGMFMMPWFTAFREENRQLLGDDLWPYGLEPNRKCLDTFLRYHYEQGISKRRLTPDELFAPETLQA